MTRIFCFSIFLLSATVGYPKAPVISMAPDGAHDQSLQLESDDAPLNVTVNKDTYVIHFPSEVSYGDVSALFPPEFRKLKSLGIAKGPVEFPADALCHLHLSTADGVRNLSRLPFDKIGGLDFFSLAIIGVQRLHLFTNLRNFSSGPFLLPSDAIVQDLVKLPNLQQIRISASKSPSDETIFKLEELKGLSYLEIHSDSRPEDGLSDAAVRSLSKHKQLVSLKLTAPSMITNNAFTYIKEIKDLRELGLNSEFINDQGLIHLSECKGLSWLELHHADIDIEGMKAIASLKNLNTLILGNSNISENAYQFFSDMKNIETLSIWSCDTLTDAFCNHLVDLPKLKKLHLFRCKNITNAGLDSIAKVKTLEYLDVLSTSIDSDSLSNLHEKIPGIRVSGNL